MSFRTSVPTASHDPALLSITDAFVEIVVTSGYTPPLNDRTVLALAETLTGFFVTTGIPLNPAEAITHFAARDQTDDKLDKQRRPDTANDGSE
jgi:hypothetical protein